MAADRPTPLSPNHGVRRNGATPDLIVLHYTAMESCDEARARLCDPEAEVSAHYLISEQGEVELLVPEELRAWHAGAGAWGRVADVNSHSIGIELANDGAQPFAARQMDALEEVLVDIMARWKIPPERIIGHSDMAPDRKFDPGPRFDWRRLALAGVSIWPDPGGPDQPFPTSLATIGYPKVTPDALLHAFRLRFRPWAEGPEDSIDRALAADLARRFPVDQTIVGA